MFASSGAPRDDQCVYAAARMIRSCTSRPLCRVDIGQYDAGLLAGDFERLSNRASCCCLLPTRGWTNTASALRHRISRERRPFLMWNAITTSYSSPSAILAIEAGSTCQRPCRFVQRSMSRRSGISNAIPFGARDGVAGMPRLVRSQFITRPTRAPGRRQLVKALTTLPIAVSGGRRAILFRTSGTHRSTMQLRNLREPMRKMAAGQLPPAVSV